MFLLWPKGGPGSPVRKRIDIAAASGFVVLAASLVSGGHAIVRDLRVAFRDAGPSVFPPEERVQMDSVLASVPARASLLLVATTEDAWHARLWQRAFYPEHTVIVRYEPLGAEELRALRKRLGIRHAISLGSPPPDPGFRSPRDLGALPGLASRVWFGELQP